MEVLFAFLNWVSSFSHVDEDSGSKMDIHNLATVITPNILSPNAVGGKREVPVDESFLAIEAVHSLIEFNETMCEIPEDLSSMLNDSSLFSSSADITTKEILKRYGDRARVPSSTPAIVHVGDTAAEQSGNSPRREGNRPNLAPVVTRVDPDPAAQHAWSTESSVRHVRDAGDGNEVPGSGAAGAGGPVLGQPQFPYALRNDSTESHGSPNRNSGRYHGAANGDRGGSAGVGIRNVQS